MTAIRTRPWQTDAVAWTIVATGVAAMVGATGVSIAFDGYDNSGLSWAWLLRLRGPQFLAAAAWAVAGPVAVMIGQCRARWTGRPSAKRPKKWGMEDL